MKSLLSQNSSIFSKTFKLTLKWISKNVVDTNPRIKQPVEIIVLSKNR